MNIRIKATSTQIKKLLIAASIITLLIPTQSIYAMEDEQKCEASEADATVSAAAALPATVDAAVVTSQRCILTEEEKSSFLHHYSQATTYDEKKIIIKKMADTFDISTMCYNGITVLDHAMGKDDLEMASILIELGADVNQINAASSSLLANQVHGQQPNNIDFLIRHGADVNKKDTQGQTAFWHAVDLEGLGFDYNNNIPYHLIEHGADINIPDNTGGTALNHAALCNHHPSIALLILAGATYTDQEFDSFSDQTKTFIGAAAYEKQQLDKQDWFAQDFVKSHILPIPPSQVEPYMRQLIGAYAEPCDTVNVFNVFDMSVEKQKDILSLINDYATEDPSNQELEPYFYTKQVLNNAIAQEINYRKRQAAKAAAQHNAIATADDSEEL